MTAERDEVRELLKRTAVALKQGGVPFALCGGYAAWARGAPEPERPDDEEPREATRARRAVTAARARDHRCA